MHLRKLQWVSQIHRTWASTFVLVGVLYLCVAPVSHSSSSARRRTQQHLSIRNFRSMSPSYDVRVRRFVGVVENACGQVNLRKLHVQTSLGMLNWRLRERELQSPFHLQIQADSLFRDSVVRNEISTATTSLPGIARTANPRQLPSPLLRYHGW